MGWSILNRRLLIMFCIQNSLNVCRCILIIHWKQRCFPLLMGWSLQRSINFLSDLPELIHVDLNAANYPSSLRMYLFALFFLLNRDNVFPSNATSWNWLFDSRAQQHCFPFFFCNSHDEDSSLIPCFWTWTKRTEFNLAVSCDVQAVVTFSPIGSMYCIFTYIWLIFMVPVGKYTIHGSYGSDNHITVVGH